MVRIVIAFLFIFVAEVGFAENTSLEIVLENPDSQPFERQMILLDIVGNYDFRITLEQLEIPKMEDFEWVQLAPDEWSENRDGGKFSLNLKRRMALFPTHSGSLHLPSITHKLEFLNADGNRETVEIKSEPMEIMAKPALGIDGDFWLPVSAIEYSDEWNEDPADLKDGELALRTVTIKALGATPQMLPPQPPMREPWLVTFTEPEERHQELTMLGPLTTVVWRWSFHPVRGEPGVLSGVDIPFYDTTDRVAKHIALAATPFGYKSFGAAKISGWQSQFSRFWLAPIALVLGILMSLLIMLPGLRTKADLWWELRHNVRQWTLRKQLRRQSETQRWHAFCKTGREYLRAIGFGDDDILVLLAPFDSHIYGEKNSGEEQLQNSAKSIYSRVKAH